MFDWVKAWTARWSGSGWWKPWAVRLLLGPPLVIAYLSLTAVGMREQVEPLAVPLHKSGFWPLTYLKAFEETRKLDLAHVLSLVLMVLVWVSWEIITAFYANGAAMTNARRLVWATGAVLLVCDSILFFVGISQAAFFGGSSVFAAALLTAMYVAMLVLAATFVNILSGRIQ